MIFTILGARGYIGSRLVKYLRSKGHEVWAPDRDDDAIFLQPLGHVIYCVGLTADFRSRPFDTVDAHVGLLAAILRKADFTSMLYLSSTRVYMGSENTGEEASLTVFPSDASYLYNLSKLTGESLCHASGHPCVRVARLSNVVGPGMDLQSGNFVADLLRQARQGEVVLESSPDSAKDYIHIDDVLTLLPKIALNGVAKVYNVASGIQTRHSQWLDFIESVTACKVVVRDDLPLQIFPPIEVTRVSLEFLFAAESIFRCEIFE